MSNRMVVTVQVYQLGCLYAGIWMVVGMQVYGWLSLYAGIRMVVSVCRYTDGCLCMQVYGWLSLHVGIGMVVSKCRSTRMIFYVRSTVYQDGFLSSKFTSTVVCIQVYQDGNLCPRIQVWLCCAVYTRKVVSVQELW